MILGAILFIVGLVVGRISRRVGGWLMIAGAVLFLGIPVLQIVYGILTA